VHTRSLTVWAQELAEHLGHHMDNEREALREYRALVAHAGDPRIEQLAEQILDDEIRHHQQFEEMRLALREEVERRGPRRRRRRPSEAQRKELLARTDALLALERDDVRELKRLARRLRQVADTEWQSAIVRAMELDTRKHILLHEQIRELLA